uniref:Uncharacterized protein n=1 Tax=Solanum tuberosum TaxID=4113 RepID=M1DFR3_SOLTU
MDRRDFLALLDLPFSFHHTTNLGFFPKLAIQTNHNFMRIMGDGLKKNHFTKPVGKELNYLGDAPSAMHREYKGADKGRAGSLSARRQMRLATSCFSPKVTKFNITFSIDIKGEVGKLGEPLSGSASSSQLAEMTRRS